MIYWHTVQQSQYFLYFKEYLIIKGSNTVWSYFTRSSQFNFASVIFFIVHQTLFIYLMFFLLYLIYLLKTLLGPGAGLLWSINKIKLPNLLTKGVKWTNIQIFVYHWYAHFWILVTSIWKEYRIFFFIYFWWFFSLWNNFIM